MNCATKLEILAPKPVTWLLQWGCLHIFARGAKRESKDLLAIREVRHSIHASRAATAERFLADFERQWAVALPLDKCGASVPGYAELISAFG